MAQLPINIGFKVGGNYSLVKSDFEIGGGSGFSTSDKNKMSFLGGTLVRIKLKKLSLQGEVLFVTRTGEVDVDSGFGSPTKADIKFSTLDIPLLVGYEVLDLKVAKLRVNAGVIPSFKASVSDINAGLGKEGYKDSFVSGAIGASVDIPLFIFDVRYQHGLGKVYELKSNISTFELNNNLLTVSVAWKII